MKLKGHGASKWPQPSSYYDGNRETKGKYFKEIKRKSSKKVTRSTAQLKCLYMNTNSLGNKQKELEATMLLEKCDVVGITEAWWDDSHDWSVPTGGYKLIRRDRQGRRGGGIACYIKKRVEYKELSLKRRYEQVKSRWVRVRDQGNKGSLMVRIYYWLPDQAEPVDEAFSLQLQEMLQSQALVLLWDFNHLVLEKAIQKSLGMYWG